MKRTFMVALGCAMLLAPARAGRTGDSVDPAIMQPGLNPAFAPWDCWRTGGGITCEGQLHGAWTNAEWGLACDGRPVYATGTEERARPARRRGRPRPVDAPHVEIRETLSLQPDGSGPTLNAGGPGAELRLRDARGRLDTGGARHRPRHPGHRVPVSGRSS